MTEARLDPSGLPDLGDWVTDLHREALVRKGADRPCPACHKKDWGVGKGTVLIQALEPSGHFSPDAASRRSWSTSENCGFLRLHAAALLTRD